MPDDEELLALADVPDFLRGEAEDYASYGNDAAATAYQHSANVLEHVLEERGD